MTGVKSSTRWYPNTEKETSRLKVQGAERGRPPNCELAVFAAALLTGLVSRIESKQREKWAWHSATIPHHRRPRTTIVPMVLQLDWDHTRYNVRSTYLLLLFASEHYNVKQGIITTENDT